DLGLRSGQHVGDKLAVFQKNIMEAAATFDFVKLVSLEGGEDGAQDPRIDQIGKGALALLAEPGEDFGGNGVVADPALQLAAQLGGLALLFEEARRLADDPGARAADERERLAHPLLFLPALRERGENAALLGGGDGVEKFVKLALF